MELFIESQRKQTSQIEYKLSFLYFLPLSIGCVSFLKLFLSSSTLSLHHILSSLPSFTPFPLFLPSLHFFLPLPLFSSSLHFLLSLPPFSSFSSFLNSLPSLPLCTRLVHGIPGARGEDEAKFHDNFPVGFFILSHEGAS